MAVLRKEYYTQTNGVHIIKVFTKPTETFPNGYFYCPAEAEDLVNNYGWYLHKSGKNRIEVITNKRDWGTQKTLIFHKELFKFYHGYDWNADIDHVSLCEIDNTNNNLNAVSHQQNSFNKLSKGYFYSNRDKCFQTSIKFKGQDYRPLNAVYREDEACTNQNHIEQIILREKLGSNYYMFDFKKYRRGSEDILDLERKGIISEEEATYRHILRYTDNAWYYLRYNLEQYFIDNHIPVPKYSIDENGFMVHPVSGQRLCPFY